MEEIVWGIDPGSSICGIVELRSGRIGNCFECEPNKVYSRIMGFCGSHRITIVIEDIFPYSMKLTPNVIDTCKLIGELTYRFNTSRQVTSVHLVPRNTVKKWIFDTAPDICIPKIEKKIMSRHGTNIKGGKRGFIKLDGTMRSPSFNWIDDKIVISALRYIYQIPTPKPGKQNIYGLKSHSWQALALVSAHLSHTTKKSSENK